VDYESSARAQEVYHSLHGNGFRHMVQCGSRDDAIKLLPGKASLKKVAAEKG
jgi:hypothetical protein